MLSWLQKHVALARATIAAGDVRAVERRYLPAALGAGVLLGCILSYLSILLAVLVIMTGGFLMGYASRSYVSYRRRQRFLVDRM